MPTKLKKFIAQSLKIILGQISWTPPAWSKSVASYANTTAMRAGNSYTKLYKEDRKKFWTYNSIVLICIAVGIGGYGWYCSLPEPHKVTFTVVEPSPTSLEKDAKPNPLVVNFSGSAARLEQSGKVINQGIQVTPPIEGTWKWTSDSTLTFDPKEDWTVGIDYLVKLDKSLIPKHIRLADHSFHFHSPAIVLSPSSGVFYEDPTDPKIKQAVITIKSTHPIDKRELENRISLKMRVEPVKTFDDSSVKNLGFKVLYNEKTSEAYIRSEVIPVPKRDGEVLLTIAEGVKSARGGNGNSGAITRTVQVPGVENYFKVTSITGGTVSDPKTFEAQRVVTISTTAGVAVDELNRNTTVIFLPNDAKTQERARKLREELGDSSGDEVGEGEENEEGEEEEEESESQQNRNSEQKCLWPSAGAVPEDIVAKAQKLSPRWIEGANDFNSTTSFSFDAPEGSCLLVRIKAGTKSFGDYPLTDDRNFLIPVEPFTPEVKVIGNGALLTVSGDKKLSIMGRNVPAIRVRLSRFLPNSIHHLVSQTYESSTFQSPSFNYYFGPDNISEVYTETLTVPAEKPGKPSYVAFDFSKYLASAPAVPKGAFLLESSGWDPATNRELSTYDRRLVLLSDLGFVVKENQIGTRALFVESIVSRDPSTEAFVKVLGKNGVPIFSGKTDGDGHVEIPKLSDFKREQTPTVFVVEKEGDFSFMPFTGWNRSLNFSRFDIGGLNTVKRAESLQAYLFSDRGVYRPGESAHLGMILKSESWNPLLSGLPLEITISDPRGVQIRKQTVTFRPEGFEGYDFDVPESALTGSYWFTLSLVRDRNQPISLATTSIRVEEFVPDKLSISSMLVPGSSLGWVNPKGLGGKVLLRNLYGTPAEGNTVKGTLSLSPRAMSLAGYSDYSFADPAAAKESFSEELVEATTNAQGEALLNFPLSKYEKATYQLIFSSEALEKEGGRGVRSSLTTIVSPRTFLVGYRHGANLSYLKKDATQLLELIAIDPKLKQINVDGLIKKIIEKQTLTVLTRQENGSLAYESVEKKIERSSEDLSISERGTKITLPTKDPGEFIVEIQEADGTVLNKIEYSVVGQSNTAGAPNREAELRIELNKNDYAPDEEIELAIQAPYTGSGLITIERDKVYAHKWFKSDTASSIQKIAVPHDLEGNAYINVSFVRDLNSREIYTNPLSYGVKHFSISRARRTHPLELDVPSQIKPGDKLEIKYKTSTPGRIALFAVDQGILQVAKYRAPDPLSSFFAKRSLEVKTSQILDLILPEYRVLQELSSTGGDEDGDMSRFRNPFKRKGLKPVVYWSGLIDTGVEPGTVSFDIPDHFNGTVKVFGVIVSSGAVGVTEKATVVQGDIVLLPNVPLVMAPGDEAEVSTSVAHLRGNEGAVSVTLDVGPQLEVISTPKVSLNIPLGKDDLAIFRVKTKESFGSVPVIFRAEDGTASARYSLDTTVRPASQRLSTIQVGAVAPGILSGASAEVSVNRALYKEEAVREVSASMTPLSLAQSLSFYLNKYPYGCTEQLTSQAYPLVVLGARPEFGVTPAELSKALDRLFSMLGARQTSSGSFVYWPGVNTTYDMVTVHIARFLIEARERGYNPPTALYDETIKFLRDLANKDDLQKDAARTRAYAIYLLTRSGVVTTNYVKALREGLEKSKETWWKDDITALFLASSYKLLKLDKDAEILAKNITISSPSKAGVPYSDSFLDSLSQTAHALALISRHFPEKLSLISEALLVDVASQLRNKQYTTMSAALLILGLDEYQKVLNPTVSSSVAVSFSEDGKNFEVAPAFGTELFPKLSIPTQVNTVRVASESPRPVFYQTIESGFDKTLPKEADNKGLEVYREYRDLKGNVITESNLGDDVEVHIVIRGERNYDHVAISDLFPSGLQLTSGTEALGGGSSSWYPTYRDAREDRALLFGPVSPGASEFVYKLKAVSRGTFVVPPIQAENMYDQAVYSRGAASSFIVR